MPLEQYEYSQGKARTIRFDKCNECGGSGTIKKVYAAWGAYELRKCKRCRGKGVVCLLPEEQKTPKTGGKN